MSVPGSGRVTPLQIDMLRLGGEVPFPGAAPSTDADRISAMRAGRASLVQRTGLDLGFDLAA